MHCPLLTQSMGSIHGLHSQINMLQVRSSKYWREPCLHVSGRHYRAIYWPSLLFKMYYCNSLSWCLWNTFYTFNISDESDAKVKFTCVSSKFSNTWRSFMGFQSCSKKMTVSAAVRLRPKPPTLVVRSMTDMLGSWLNCCTIPNRCDASTLHRTSPQIP